MNMGASGMMLVGMVDYSILRGGMQGDSARKDLPKYKTAKYELLWQTKLQNRRTVSQIQIRNDGGLF
jgi:hypothetical protein